MLIDLLGQYGLFLAKTLTLVLAFLIVVAGAAQFNQRKKNDEGTLFIEHVNEKHEAIEQALNAQLLDDSSYNKWLKDQKKQEKQRLKAAKNTESSSKPRIYLIDFNGDVQAHGTEALAMLVNAILLQVRPEQDEVVLRLESPGGVVHGYGLAASQLLRLRQRGIPLTICVDKVAASGGYMMACTGSKILAAPFAVLGSIGVVAQLPNIHRLLKKHDIEVETLTAGEYKRTLTVLGENTEKGRQKMQDDINDTHQLFKYFVQQQRPQLDMEKLATGEIWYGSQALDLNLVDGIQTSDDYLFEKASQADIYRLEWKTKPTLSERIGLQVQQGVRQVIDNITNRVF